MIRIVLIVLIALGLGGFGVVAWMVLPDSAAPPVAPSTKVAVLAAARAIRAGVLLKPEDIGTIQVDAAALPPSYVPDQSDASRMLIGGMVRRSLSANDVFRLPMDVLRPADHGFLAAVLAPGTRAVTIAVDAVSGTAGLIWPGDRVDLILTQTLAEAAQIPGRRVSAETVLRDLRVIAIDQQIVKLDSDAGAEVKPVRTITLEVSPASAEAVQVANKLGQISLSVRSVEQGVASVLETGITYSSDVSNALPAQATRSTISSMRVFQGASDGKEFKF